ncbi:MAG: hypothetical protein KIT68_07205 [Phycisphaeraceae bacterium]|nr:hypothetical protein [Phycisphaeraceae bacterium]
MLRPTLVAVLLLAAAAHSHADDPALRAWFDRRLQIAADGVPTSGFRFQWRLENLEVPTEAQLNALRQAVQGRPDHPERQTLATYEWRQKNTQYTDKVLWNLDGVFRFNETFHWPSKSQFADRATHPSATWLLTEGQITLVDADGPVEPGYDYRASVTRVHMRELRYFFTGGLYAPAGADRSGALRLSGDRWSCRFESTDASGVRRVVEASGAWHADAGHGTVDRADMRAATGDKVERQLIHAKDWRIEPALGEVSSPTRCSSVPPTVAPCAATCSPASSPSPPPTWPASPPSPPSAAPIPSGANSPPAACPTCAATAASTTAVCLTVKCRRC